MIRKFFYCTAFGIQEIFKIDAFREAFLIIFSYLALNLTTTYFIYTDWSFSFFVAESDWILRLTFAFFGGCFVWGVILISVAFLVRAFISFISGILDIPVLGTRKYYKVFDLLKGEKK